MLTRFAPQYQRRLVTNLCAIFAMLVVVGLALWNGQLGLVTIATALYFTAFAIYKFTGPGVRPALGAWLLVGALLLAEALFFFFFFYTSTSTSATAPRLHEVELMGIVILVWALFITQRNILFTSRGKTASQGINEILEANRRHRESIDAERPDA